MSNVLIIGDTHCPAMLDFYEFLSEVYEAWDCDRVVHIGDLVDFHELVSIQKEFGIPDIEKEIEDSREQVQALYKHFPEVDYLTGNHSALPVRQAQEAAGLPPSLVLSLSAILDLPKGWNVHPRYTDLVIDNVIYRHGDKGRSNQTNAAFLNAQNEFMSVVQGHQHSQGGVLTVLTRVQDTLVCKSGVE